MNKATYLIILLVLILSGCKSPETLEESVNNRWAAIVNDDLEQAYEYLSPGYREIEDLNSYKMRIATAKINMNWSRGQFVSADCETESACQVLVEVAYTFTFPQRSMGSTEAVTNLGENWIKLNGTWRHVPNRK